MRGDRHVLILFLDRLTLAEQKLPLGQGRNAVRSAWRPVGAENPVMLCDLDILVDKAAESVSSQWPDDRCGSWSSAALTTPRGGATSWRALLK
jgi:hypothetical protein